MACAALGEDGRSPSVAFNFEAAIGFLMLYVVPRFARVYEDTASTLPFFSRLLLGATWSTPLSCARPSACGCSPTAPRAAARPSTTSSTCSTPPRCWTSDMASTLRNRCARTCAARVPAGALCWRDGALYRPAKIRVPRYGAGAAPAHSSRSTSAGDHACITPASHNPR